jgi:hypothetical protein
MNPNNWNLFLFPFHLAKGDMFQDAGQKAKKPNLANR